MELLKAITPDQWGIIGESAISGLLLSPIMAGVKKWFKVHRELVMLIYVIGGAMVAAALAYVQANPDVAPWFRIPVQGSITFVFSQIAYYAAFKPIRDRFRGMVAEAEQLNEAKRSAAIPAEAK